MTSLNLLSNFFVVNKIQNILSGWLPLYLLTVAPGYLDFKGI